MGEWKEFKISDIADVIGGGTPKTTLPEYWNGNIPWLSVVDFNTGRKYVSNTEKTITNLGLEKSSTKLLQKNDIIISARGTVGALAMLDKPMTFNQSCYGLRAKENVSINDYLFYLLKNTVKQLQQVSYGAVFDTITRNTFDETDILLPPLEEQKAIAEVLSSLDYKIDLLHRQNKTLEALAQTLFRQWFIEEATDEWETCKLSDIAVMQNGFSFSSKHYIPYEKEHLEVLKMGHIERGGGLKLNPKKDFVPREEKLEKWILNKNDIVMAMTDMKDNVVILGVPAIIDKSDKYVLNQRVARIYLKSDEKLLNNYLLYVQLKDPDFIALLQSKANSGVQVNLSTQSIKDSEIIIPPMGIQKTIGKDITDLYLKKENNDVQIKTLENMRDTLLPKLMSGEVRVKL
ncbi:restriction endonuclease subunit S [Sulfurovum sp.]|uniref:restriction endonuclease subunit S n=1 Tax=Sulfurovum sp. TaxID=1969726 RepID=UPI00356A533F